MNTTQEHHIAPKEHYGVHVELDITPFWWAASTEEPQAVGAAVAALVKFDPTNIEIRACRSFLKVLVTIPANDVPILGLVRRRAELKERVTQIGEENLKLGGWMRRDRKVYMEMDRNREMLWSMGKGPKS